MTDSVSQRLLCGHFATLFTYPAEGLRETAVACSTLLRKVCPEAEAALTDFVTFLRTNTASRIEEVYTVTFDLQPVCFPYVGYQLCGEGQQRALFLMELQRLYREHEFDSGGELPDHIGTVLRFLGLVDDGDCRREIVRDGLLPALDKILQGLDSGEHPYADLIKALHVFLTGILEPETELSTAATLGENRQKEYCS